MSFLLNLQNRKASLKLTNTTVTLPDGRRYIEQHSSSSQHVDFIPSAQFGFVVDTAPDETPVQVVHNLFLGAQDCCAPAPLLKHGIDFVLSIGVEAPHRLPHVDYHFVECLDLPETVLAPVISHCSEVIVKRLRAGSKLLVHCNAGVSRSSAVVIGYLIQHHGLTYEDAYAMVKSARPAIQPNIGFVNQLRNLYLT